MEVNFKCLTNWFLLARRRSVNFITGNPGKNREKGIYFWLVIFALE